VRAAYYHGDRTIQVGDCAVRPPGPDEVRIEVVHCGVCGTDFHIFQGHLDKRVAMPHVMGHEMSGEIADVGSSVKEWQVGDRVVVRPLDPCGHCAACQEGHSYICYNLKFLGIDTPGALQGSWTVPAHTLHRLPEHIPLDEAALIEPIAVACHDVSVGGVKPGEEVVVIGGGPIGMLNALVAQRVGGRVVVSEVNPFRVNLARELGLEAVNPLESDLVALVEERTEGVGADVVFEVSGSSSGAAVMTDLARTHGRIVIVANFLPPPQVDLYRVFWRELKIYGARVYEARDFDKAIELLATGALPVNRLISARRPLEDLTWAFQQMESGGSVMKILINTQGD
jgi:(R,R)-butanediol dehydrogenase/meso-butanediol dehydrogenase/diacetyl reductase